jgi:hypothetical protein
MKIPCIGSNFINKYEGQYYKEDLDARKDEADYQAIMGLVKQDRNQSNMISLTTLHRILDWKAGKRKNLKRFATEKSCGRKDFYEYIYVPRFDIIINNRISKDLYLSLLIFDTADFLQKYQNNLAQLIVTELSKVRERAKGFGIPVASTVLHFLDPKRFPIMDIRTREMLYLTDEIESMMGDNPKKYEQFRSAMLRIQNTTGCNLHKIDRALWHFHKVELQEEVKQIYIKFSRKFSPDLSDEEIGKGPSLEADVEFRRLLIDVIKWEAQNATSVGSIEKSESPESKPIEPINADNNSENSPSGDERGNDKEELPIIIVLSDNAADELILADVKPQCGARKYRENPAKNANTSWEIPVSKSSEFGKLPLSKFPVTTQSTTGAIRKKDPGIAVRLACRCHQENQLQCEASLHRYKKGSFYIGTASKRLGGSQNWTAQYRKFLDAHGLRRLVTTEQPKHVLLKFEAVNPT